MKFITKTQKKRSAVSPVIATLLLIAIAVAAAIIVYAFVTGLIGGLSNGSGSNLYPTTATLVVPTGVSPGTLVITVLNSGNSPINSIVVNLGSAASGIKDTNNGNFCMGESPVTGNYCQSIVAAVAACPIALATDSSVFCDGANKPIGAGAGQDTLGVGSQVSASVGVQSAGSTLQSGQTYTFTVTVGLVNGGTHTELVSATAQI